MRSLAAIRLKGYLNIMINRLFVYGTLGPDRPNEQVLTDIGGTWEKGYVFGVLCKEGWGASMGYPGIILDKNGRKVEGFLFSSDKISGHWMELDNFEGEGYERVLTKVKLQNGSIVDAYIYALKSNQG